MAPPLISVIVTCYNYERYVADAIESVLSQQYAKRQLVVVNDGSKDDSLGIIRRYVDEIVLVDQTNQGHIAACDSGLRAAQGEVVIFLDADDLLEPGALAAVGSAWYSGCAKVQFDLKIIDSEGRDLGRRFCHFPKAYDAAVVRETFLSTGTYRWPVTVGNAYSKWFLERLFPMEAELAPDGYLNTVAPVYGDVVTVSKALGCYRVHGSNQWSNTGNDNARLPERIRHRLREVAFMREHARNNGVAVPGGNVLDHEIAFINYRMMALALGLHYEGRNDDSAAALVARASRLLWKEKYPPALRAGHLLWLTLLAIAPRTFAGRLIALRFSRSELKKKMRLRFDRLWRRSARAA